MPGWLRKKVTTSQLANQIFMDELKKQTKPLKEDALLGVIQYSFAAAERFDAVMEEYLKPPPGVVPPDVAHPDKKIRLTT
jgi:hypothetical protein